MKKKDVKCQLKQNIISWGVFSWWFNSSESILGQIWQVCAPCQLFVTAWLRGSCFYFSVWLFGMCTLWLSACQPHVSNRFFSIFGFNLWFLCANTHLKMWNPLVDKCFQVMCVSGRECGTVCLSLCLHCHRGFDLCTCCYWPPLICWSGILSKSNILVWWCWTNKHQPVNISQDRYEGGEVILPSSTRGVGL